MTALTLHAMDYELAEALRRRATEMGESLNQTAKGLLSMALGLSGEREKPSPGFMRFAGRLSGKDVADMKRFVENADFSKVDPGDWK
jgi:plasmid stability protein